MLQDSCHDLLQAIHYEVSNTNISWQYLHIKGHMDDTIHYNDLDRPSQLNVIVDYIAKAFLNDPEAVPNYHQVHSPAWSLFIHDIALLTNINQSIYDLVHTPTAQQYWIKKSCITYDSFNSVNWQGLERAFNKMPLSRRLFCCKHIAGMCGVGKFQKIWKTSETDECPHCGMIEDSLHVWKCQARTVSTIWSDSLKTLEYALRKIDTCPDLIDLILQYLNAWRYDDDVHPLTKPSLRKLLELQDTIGARQFFEGWVHKEWDVLQTRYLSEISSRRSGKRWTSALISKMWDVAWDLWEHRNAVYHHKSNKALSADTAILDTQVRELIQ
jgi:hypothetical protein